MILRTSLFVHPGTDQDGSSECCLLSDRRRILSGGSADDCFDSSQGCSGRNLRWRYRTLSMSDNRTATERASRAAGRALRSIVQAARDLAAAALAGSSFAMAIVVVILLAGILIVSQIGRAHV